MDFDQALKAIGLEWSGTEQDKFIKYDPKLKHQYVIRRGSTHDGTLVFTIELIHKALINLLNKSSYYKPMGECPEGMKPVYTIGKIRRYGIYGNVDLPIRPNVPGVRERIAIPVRVEYVKS